jgi:predicted nucleotidyltransferase
VTAVVEEYVAEVVDAIDAVVPVAGAYVLGSALLGGFDPATSDLDVVVVVERPLEADVRTRVWDALDELPPPVRKLELVVYAAGARPPTYDLNYPDGDGEAGFWFVLDAAIAQERAHPMRGQPWRELLEPVTEAETRRAAEEMLHWAEERDDELARPHGVRARHYLEHGTWMTKAEARR